MPKISTLNPISLLAYLLVYRAFREQTDLNNIRRKTDKTVWGGGAGWPAWPAKDQGARDTAVALS